MELLTIVIGGGLLFVLYGWRVIRPYLFYRDVVSGAISSDGISFILTQGLISGGVAVYFLIAVGFKNLTSALIISAFLLMAVVSLYFGVKAWRWSRNSRRVEQRS